MTLYTGPGVPIDQSDQTPAWPQSAPLVAPADSLNPFLIPDGFSYNTRLKQLPYRIVPMQLRLLDRYRRESLQGLWQPRYYVVPADAGVAIIAGDTLNYELHVARGSVLWGYRFFAITGTAANFRITMTDVCANQNLISPYETASAFVPNFGTGGSPISGFNYILMAEPRPIAGDGDLNVNIVNGDTSDRQCQLLLMFAEPAGRPQ